MTLQDMQDHVQNSAMDRYVADLQVEAQDAVKATAHWERKVAEDKGEEKNETSRRRELAQRNQHELRAQIEENKMRRAEDRREFIEAASSHSFPLFTETFISLDEYNAYRDNQKKIFRQELDDQMTCIKTMKNLQAKQDRDHAHAKHVQNISELTRSRQDERDRRVQVASKMVNSWDRDIRMHNIKKAILNGKDVVQQTLGPGALQAGSEALASPQGSRSRRGITPSARS